MTKFNEFAVETHWLLVKDRKDISICFPDYPKRCFP